MAFSALKWIHGFLPMENPLVGAALCTNIVEAEKRQPNLPVTKKAPVEVSVIRKIVSRYAPPSSTLKDLRLAALCVLAGLFRSKELLDVRADHISVCDDYLVVFIPSSKTDVYRKGQHAFITKSNNFTCPYSLLIRYASAAGITLNGSSNEFLFRNVIFRKSQKSYLLGTRRLSYTRARELVKEALQSLGLDSSKYGLHSFRSGGATSLAKSLAKNPSKERLIKLQGRWKSDHAKNMYIEDTLEDRLLASSSLGL